MPSPIEARLAETIADDTEHVTGHRPTAAEAAADAANLFPQVTMLAVAHMIRAATQPHPA